MSLAALEDDGEATRSHFSHQVELEKLLAGLLGGGASASISEEELDRLVREMGAIVCDVLGVVTDGM